MLSVVGIVGGGGGLLAKLRLVVQQVCEELAHGERSVIRKSSEQYVEKQKSLWFVIEKSGRLC